MNDETAWTVHMYWDAYGEEIWYVLKDHDPDQRFDMQDRESAFDYARYCEDRES